MGLGRPGERQKVRKVGARALRGPSCVALAMILLAGAQVLTGCTSQSIGDSLPPSMGGLPESVPKRTVDPAVYPAVHDMPPARSASPLTEAEKKRLREELAAERERAAKQAGVSASGVSGSGAARNP
jgi:hypothetical protein